MVRNCETKDLRQSVMGKAEEKVLNELCPQHSGWLIKQGGSHKNWKRRYFILQDWMLLYFNKVPEAIVPAKATGVIPIHTILAHIDASADVKSKDAKGARKNKPLMKIPVCTERNHYYVQGENQEELEAWKEVLIHAVELYAKHIDGKGRKVTASEIVTKAPVIESKRLAGGTITQGSMKGRARTNQGIPSSQLVVDDVRGQQLYEAVVADDVDAVADLLTLDPHSITCYQNPIDMQQTPLHAAVAYGHTRCTKMILDVSVLASGISDEMGWYPLHLAAHMANYDCIRELLDTDSAEQAIVAPDKMGRTPAYLSIISGDRICSELLIKAQQKTQGTDCPWKHFHLLCLAGEETAVEQFLYPRGRAKPGPNELNVRGDLGLTPFHLAAVRGSTELGHLLNSKTSVHSFPDELGKTPCHIAAAAGNVNFLEALGNTKLIHPADKAGKTPLGFAVGRGYESAAKVLLKCGVEVNVVDRDGFGVVHVACLHNRKRVLPLLIEHEVDINAKGGGGLHPLHICALVNLIECASILINAGAKIDARDEQSRTPLFLAAQLGYKELVDILLAAGADVDAVDGGGKSSLRAAMDAGQGDVVNSLLARGASVENGDEEGHTPLMTAILQGNACLCKTLLSSGRLSLSDEDALGRTALLLAIQLQHTEIVAVLMAGATSADINYVTSLQGWTALHEATRVGYRAGVELLLDHGADINLAEEVNGRTPLLTALSAQQYPMVPILLQAGADAALASKEHVLPLHLAAQSGRSDLVHLIAPLTKDIDMQTDVYGRTPLMEACYGGVDEAHNTCVEMLVGVGADVNAVDSEGCTPLMIVSGKGNEVAMKMLLKAGADVNKVDHAGRNAFLHACQYGKWGLAVVSALAPDASYYTVDDSGNGPLHYLCGSGAVEMLGYVLGEVGDDVRYYSANADKNTPVMVGAYGGHAGCIQLCKGRPIDIEAVNDEGKNCLHLAAEFGNEASVRVILGMGAEVSEVVEDDGQTALHLASQRGCIETVATLIGAGASVHDTDDGCALPLHYAARYGHVQVVRQLAAAGSHVDVLDGEGRTPLVLAALYGHLPCILALHELGAKVEGLVSASAKGDAACVEMLLSLGADVNMTDSAGVSALMHATIVGEVSVVQHLLDCGASVGLADHGGLTALHYAARGGSAEVIAALLARGADCSALSQGRVSALQIASYLADDSCVQVFVRAGVDTTHIDEEDRSALHWCAAGGDGRIVKVLLAYGALMSVDQRGWTPLHVASLKGHYRVVEALLEAAPDWIDVQDHKQRTALFLATVRGHHAVAMLLLSCGANGALSPLTSSVAHEASLRGDLPLLQALHTHGISMAIDILGILPLHNALAGGASNEVLGCLPQPTLPLSKPLSASAALGGNMKCLRYVTALGEKVDRTALDQVLALASHSAVLESRCRDSIRIQ